MQQHVIIHATGLSSHCLHCIIAIACWAHLHRSMRRRAGLRQIREGRDGRPCSFRLRRKRRAARGHRRHGVAGRGPHFHGRRRSHHSRSRHRKVLLHVCGRRVGLSLRDAKRFPWLQDSWSHAWAETVAASCRSLTQQNGWGQSGASWGLQALRKSKVQRPVVHGLQLGGQIVRFCMRTSCQLLCKCRSGRACRKFSTLRANSSTSATTSLVARSSLKSCRRKLPRMPQAAVGHLGPQKWPAAAALARAPRCPGPRLPFEVLQGQGAGLTLGKRRYASSKVQGGPEHPAWSASSRRRVLNTYSAQRRGAAGQRLIRATLDMSGKQRIIRTYDILPR